MTEPAIFDYAAIRNALEQNGLEEAPACPKCEGGGWEIYGLGRGDPHQRICTDCGNPEDLPCP